jgi:hypothetical protein
LIAKFARKNPKIIAECYYDFFWQILQSIMNFEKLMETETYKHCVTKFLQYTDCLKCQVINHSMLQKFSSLQLHTLYVHFENPAIFTQINKISCLKISLQYGSQTNFCGNLLLHFKDCCKTLCLSFEYEGLYLSMLNVISFQMKNLKHLQIFHFGEFGLAVPISYLNNVLKAHENLKTLKLYNFDTELPIDEFSKHESLETLEVDFHFESHCEPGKIKLKNFPNLKTLKVTEKGETIQNL